MPIKSNWVAAEQYTHNDQNAIATQVNKVTGFHVDAYGADPTGATFSDTAVDAALTAIGSSPGILVFGVGTYKLNTTKTLAYRGQGIKGQGSGLTKIDWRGTGDCLRVWDSAVSGVGSPPPGHAGPITGLWIDGSNNANTNTCGLHIGDLYRIVIQDVYISEFDVSGGKGFWQENLYTWSERGQIQLVVDDCTDCVVFETNASHPTTSSSLSYNTYNLAVSTTGNKNGVTFKNHIGMYGVDFTLFGNCHPAAGSNTGVALTIGTTGTDSSFIDGSVTVIMETIGTAGIGHKDINIGAVAALKGVGSLEFIDWGSGAWVAGSASPSTVSFAGRINSASLGLLTGNEVHHAIGKSITTGNNFITGPAGTNRSLFVQSGGSTRWEIQTSAGAESGSNAGSDLAINSYSDAGAYLTTPMSISRASGTPSFFAGLQVYGNANVSAATNNAGDVLTTNASQTESNKRITPRVGTVASSATPSINTDTVDVYTITALTQAITSMSTNLTGTPTNGQSLWIAITGTAARAIAWGASFEASTVALPTTTVTTARLDVEFIWNAATSKWRCVRAV